MLHMILFNLNWARVLRRRDFYYIVAKISDQQFLVFYSPFKRINPYNLFSILLKGVYNPLPRNLNALPVFKCNFLEKEVFYKKSLFYRIFLIYF